VYDGPRDQWDAFVHGDEASSFCHLAAWRDIMSDVMGAECAYLVAKNEGGEWQGLLPLVRVKSRLAGHYLVSMPFLNYGGPIGSTLAQTSLAETALGEAQRSGVDLLELRSRHTFFSSLAHSHRKITVLLPLPGTPDDLWQNTFRAKLRSQIRRPMRDGMSVSFGEHEIPAFYEVFTQKMRDLGTPVLPRQLFEQIAAKFGQSAQFGVVYRNKRPVAGGCGFAWNGEFELTWACSLRGLNRQAPNMLLYWAFMERMIELGMRVFNFGRCTPGGGTHRFKSQWGGQETPLPWRQWSAKGLGSTPSPDRWRYRVAAAVWQRLPLLVTSRVGPQLARKLP
jgi:FemAB-related protein (PEP-CTERM system-associated)